MKTKTADLIGPALDWAVAKCEGYTLTSDGISLLLNRGNELRILGANCSSLAYTPSTDWSQGGPIIERERITLDFYCSPNESRAALGYAEYDDEGEYVEGSDHEQTGPTPLIAAMRCFVTSKLGDEIDIPEELR